MSKTVLLCSQIRQGWDQRALKELVDEVTNGGRKPLPTEAAETIMDWAEEVKYPGARAAPRDVASPSNWEANPVPHSVRRCLRQPPSLSVPGWVRPREVLRRPPVWVPVQEREPERAPAQAERRLIPFYFPHR
jgi:hypothetical protein